MLQKSEEIQKAISDMEEEISKNEKFITCLLSFIGVAKKLDNKVFNKKFTDELKKSLSENFNVYDYKITYNGTIEFPVYIKNCTNYDVNNYKYFRFERNCFNETETGKLRINAQAFKERCLEIRHKIVADNTLLREDMNNVYQMLADAQALKQHYEEYNSKYSYNLKSRFKCYYRITNY